MMMKVSLLSRLPRFNALHGVTNKYRDYLSIMKDQGTDGLCWAYSLSSAMETRYALDSGNRLMLDPLTLYNRSVPWWKSHCKEEWCKHCTQYSKTIDKGYFQDCAINYMLISHDTMIQADGEDSYLMISNASTVNITTVEELNKSLDEYGILYSAIDGSTLKQYTQSSTIDFYYSSNTTNHAVVITALGTIDEQPDLYVEIINSWGYDRFYDGLIYIKVADNSTSSLFNNFAIFNENYGIEVKHISVREEITYFALMIVFICLLIVAVLIAIYEEIHRRRLKQILASKESSSSSSSIHQLHQQDDENKSNLNKPLSSSEPTTVTKL